MVVLVIGVWHPRHTLQPSAHGLSLVRRLPELHPISSTDKPFVQIERADALDDNDAVTQQTIEQMCGYIRESLADPLVARAAVEAQQRFGSGNGSCNDGRSTNALDAWGVFWYVKHLLKFRSDDGALLEFQGEQGQQDLLISPAVLLRMRQPKEDCDGFSMLTCALLGELGIPAYLCTIAVDPSDPERWSHVFVVAMVDGVPLPLDTSHGSAPGWMVPEERIFRLQCWDMDGKRADLNWKRRKRSTLHGYVNIARGFRGLAGLGDCVQDPDTGEISCTDNTPATGGAIPDTFGGTGPGSGGMGPTPSTGMTAAQIAALINSAGSAVANDLRAFNAPAGYVYNPQTGRYVPAVGSTLTSSLGSMLPLLGIGLAAFLVIQMVGKR